MAKKILSKVALEEAVKIYFDPKNVYNWDEVANIINEQFNIKITGAGLRSRYHRALKQHGITSVHQSVPNTTVPIQVLPQTVPVSSTANISPSVGISQQVPVTPAPATVTSSPNRVFDKKFKNNEELDDKIKEMFGIET